MAFSQYRIEGNDGNIIVISSTNRNQYTIKVGEEPPVTPLDDPTPITQNIYCYHYDVGVGEPSSVLNIPTNLPICPIGIDDIFNHYSNSKPSDYYSSDSYILNKALFDSCAYWVWGSYDLGGMVVLRTDNDEVQISIINGFYQLGENSYCYNTGTKTITVDQSQNIILSIGAGNDPNNSLQFMIGSGNLDVWLYEPIKNIAGNIDYYEAIENYSNVIPSIWADYSQYVGLETQTSQADAPAYLWGGNVSGYQWATADLPVPYDNKISGDWSGNSEVDEEGNPFINGGVSGIGGGWGDYPNISVSIDTTNAESMSVDAISSGFLTLYSPTPQQMIEFNNFLFSGITDSIAVQLKKLTSDPLQYILFCAMVHYTPRGSISDKIGLAGIDTGVYALKLDKQYYNLNCGELNIPEATKSFLDYGNFSKVSIYLPYIGIQPLNIDDVMGATLKVVYNINQLDGSCIAQIKCSRKARRGGDTTINSVLYTFNGNIFTTIPMFATDWRGAVSSMMGILGGVSSIATGNPAGVVSGIGAVANSVTQEKVSVGRAGNQSTSYGYMDNQKPYLILERPVQNIPTDYGKFRGYPSNIHQKLSNLKGYTEIDSSDMYATSFMGITEDELSELKDLVEGGVYL